MPARPTPAAKSAVPAKNHLATIGEGALVFFVTLLAYLPALRGGLLWDDAAHITAPELRSFDGLRRIWFELDATQQYYPLLHTAFWLEHRLWGDAILGYHLINVALHAATACLVLAVMRRLLLPGALLAALIFALHPVGVESVAWISEQKNTLSAVFYLAALGVYLRFDERRRRSHYLLALGLFVLALATKTVTATLPAALLVIFWWRRGRLDAKRDVMPLLPWFVLGIAAGLVSVWVERTLIGAQGENFSLSLLERSLLAGRAIWFYLGKLAWPVELIFIYPRWTIDASAGWQYLFPLGVLALVATLVVVARRQRGPLAGFLIFAGTLFPALGFFNVFPFVYSYVADHFQYLANLGIIVPMAAALTASAKRLSTAASRFVPTIASGVLLIVLGGLTWRQCLHYRDAETLYRATLVQNPDCSMAHNNLGDLLSARPGRADEARAHFEAAIRANPRNAEAHNNLGRLLAQNPARLPDAMAEYETALRLYPDFAQAHNNLGVALSTVPDRLPDAIAHYETAVRLAPEAADMRNNLGAALARVPGREREAVAQFEAALRLAPGFAQAHNNLGLTLARIPGRLPEAVSHFQTAVQLDPKSVEALTNLGAILAQDPAHTRDAIAAFEAALRLDPESAQAHNNLGIVLSGIPERATEAILRFEQAVRLDPKSVEAHNNLANTLAGIPGRLPDAIRAYEAALRLDPGSATVHTQYGRALLQIPARESDAMAEFKAAIRLDPAAFEAHYILGVLLAEHPERRQEALRHFETVLRLRPDFTPAREWAERLRITTP